MLIDSLCADTYTYRLNIVQLPKRSSALIFNRLGVLVPRFLKAYTFKCQVVLVPICLMAYMFKYWEVQAPRRSSGLDVQVPRFSYA